MKIAVSSNKYMFYIVLTKKQNVNKIRETAMTKHTNQTMLFKEISGKKVEVDFNGGEVSCDVHNMQF
jgi:hypothetical protein